MHTTRHYNIEDIKDISVLRNTPEELDALFPVSTNEGKFLEEFPLCRFRCTEDDKPQGIIVSILQTIIITKMWATEVFKAIKTFMPDHPIYSILIHFQQEYDRKGTKSDTKSDTARYVKDFIDLFTKVMFFNLHRFSPFQDENGDKFDGRSPLGFFSNYNFRNNWMFPNDSFRFTGMTQTKINRMVWLISSNPDYADAAKDFFLKVFGVQLFWRTASTNIMADFAFLMCGYDSEPITSIGFTDISVTPVHNHTNNRKTAVRKITVRPPSAPRPSPVTAPRDQKSVFPQKDGTTPTYSAIIAATVFGAGSDSDESVVVDDDDTDDEVEKDLKRVAQDIHSDSGSDDSDSVRSEISQLHAKLRAHTDESSKITKNLLDDIEMLELKILAQ